MKVRGEQGGESLQVPEGSGVVILIRARMRNPNWRSMGLNSTPRMVVNCRKSYQPISVLGMFSAGTNTVGTASRDRDYPPKRMHQALLALILISGPCRFDTQ